MARGKVMYNFRSEFHGELTNGIRRYPIHYDGATDSPTWLKDPFIPSGLNPQSMLLGS
jgi:hypothetical protein